MHVLCMEGYDQELQGAVRLMDVRRVRERELGNGELQG